MAKQWPSGGQGKQISCPSWIPIKAYSIIREFAQKYFINLSTQNQARFFLRVVNW
jgi:hypothetical protein